MDATTAYCEMQHHSGKGSLTKVKFWFLKVQTKTVAQCVEFYYTYKKQVKIGRNGILTFGPPDSPEEKHTEAVVDIKVEWLKFTIVTIMYHPIFFSHEVVGTPSWN